MDSLQNLHWRLQFARIRSAKCEVRQEKGVPQHPGHLSLSPSRRRHELQTRNLQQEVSQGFTNMPEQTGQVSADALRVMGISCDINGVGAKPRFRAGTPGLWQGQWMGSPTMAHRLIGRIPHPVYIHSTWWRYAGLPSLVRQASGCPALKYRSSGSFHAQLFTMAWVASSCSGYPLSHRKSPQ